MHTTIRTATLLDFSFAVLSLTLAKNLSVFGKRLNLKQENL